MLRREATVEFSQPFQWLEASTQPIASLRDAYLIGHMHPGPEGPG
ncbi:MAG TPA: hypothetical protein VI306_02690 [Pyrinomonadaceae bacterium]